MTATGREGGTLPRSFLYVPAVKPNLFAKATAGRSDAVVLDLEDAVPMPDKDTARAHVRTWLTARSPGDGAQQWIRVDADALAEDLAAAVAPALDGIFLAKSSAAGLAEASRLLESLEAERGLEACSVGVVALVESAAALLELAAMAREPRLRTFALGEADLFADLRITRSTRSATAIDALRTQVVVNGAAAGLEAPVAPTSTDFRDLERFAETSRELFDLGFRSRTAIHPGQVPVINEVFSPDADAVAAATDVMARFEAAEGGVTTDASGRLIDAAVVRSARETLSRRPPG